MTIIKQIMAEIERRINVIKPQEGQGIILCGQLTKQLQDLLSFLSTLESEKPIEGLEEEIDRIVKCEKEFMNFQCRSQLIAYIARYFAQWGAEHVKNSDEKPVPADLEEAAWKYAPDLPSYNIGGGYLPPQSRDDLRTAFKDGAKWQAEQDQETIELAEDHAYLAGAVNEREKILSEAVEGEITKDNRGNNVVRAGVFNKDYEYGDKVRVIVLPKED